MAIAISGHAMRPSVPFDCGQHAGARVFLHAKAIA